MKNLIFLILLTTVFFMTACEETPDTSQIDNGNPVMVAQKEKGTVVTAEEATTEVDNMKTANQPTSATTEDIKNAPVAPKEMTDKSAPSTAAKPKPQTAKKKTVIPAAKVEKPEPMTTEVEAKVKVMANEAEKSTAENNGVTPAATKEASAPPRPTSDNTAAEKETTSAKEVVAAKPDHSAWDKILRANVSSAGKVNYAGIKTQKGQLESYLEDLESNSPQSDWARNEKLAYWINVYNAYTIKMIVDNYPTKSIMDLAGGKPFDKKWIKIAGKTYSLNDIENTIIRPQFNEPRIHFAVNCAAQSCPPVLNRAWTADNLNSNLTKQAKAFINNEKFNQISANSITVSKIFDWYGKDFGNLISYLNKYSNTKIDANASVNYKEYDWALNN